MTEDIVKKQIGVLRVRASIDPSTFDKNTRSVDVTFATETPVLINSWDGPFYEILDVNPNSIRSDRANMGLPVLDEHDSYAGAKDGILGRATDITYVAKQARAKITFSRRAGLDDLVRDVQDGIVKDISVGYRVYKYIQEGTYKEIPMLRAIDWEPHEISLAVIPRDINSHTRSQQQTSTNEVIILNNRSQMETEHQQPAAQPAPAAAATQQPAAQPAPAAAATEGNRSMTAEQERTRSTQIIAAVRSAKLKPEFGDRLIADGTTIERARELVIDEFSRSDPHNGTRSQHDMQITNDEADKRVEGMTDALSFRANPGLFKPDPKNEYRSFDLDAMARECLEHIGVKTRGMSKVDVARMSMGITRDRSGMMSTGDFPIILGNTINRVLRKAYEITPRTFMAISNVGFAKDFRPMTKVQMTELSGFSKVEEGAEYTFGTFGESKEVYAISKYGKIYTFTWEMMVNDDLDALSRIPKSIGNKAAQNQSNIFWAIITLNAAMGDGVALFHANHGNLASAGTALSITSLSAGKAAMRAQKDPSGDFINLEPSYLVVPPELELLAYQYTSQAYVPNDPVKVNPAFNTSLKVIVEPRLSANSATAWYLVADPGQIDTIEHASLEGEGELYTEQRYGFEVDGVQTKARSTFGAKALDWRGMYKNPGA